MAQPTDASNASGGADSAPDAADNDNIAQVTPIRRVESVGTLMVPIHREPAPRVTPKPERKGMSLSLKPFTPVRKNQRMSTMSDLTDQTNPTPQSQIARVKDRHFASKVRIAEPPSEEHRKTAEPSQDRD